MDNQQMTECNYIEFEDFRLFFKRIKYPANPSEPVLIFLHDSWGCIRMWNDFPEMLVKIFGLNALVYDRRGHGKSSPFSEKPRTRYYLDEEADTLIRVMNSLDIKKAILYGHSDGATISIIAGAMFPGRIAGLILESPHTFREKSGIEAVRKSRDDAKKNSLLPSLRKFHDDKTEELFKRWHETWLGEAFADWTIVPVLKNIQCPVVAFRGENDLLDTEAQLDILKNEISSKVLITKIPNAGHTPHKENEEETVKWVSKFLKITD